MCAKSNTAKHVVQQMSSWQLEILQSCQLRFVTCKFVQKISLSDMSPFASGFPYATKRFEVAWSIPGIEVQTPSSAGSLQGGMMGHMVGPPSGGTAQQPYGGVAPQQQSEFKTLEMLSLIPKPLCVEENTKQKAQYETHSFYFIL